MTFVLILTIFGFDEPNMQYAVATDLSGIGCIESLEHHQKLLEQTFNRVDFDLSCELDDMHED